MKQIEAKLSQLSEDDVYKLNEQKRIIQDVEKQLSVLRVGHQAFWKALADKYGLPRDFQVDEAGQIFVNVVLDEEIVVGKESPDE
jgi:hypothetical protein